MAQNLSEYVAGKTSDKSLIAIIRFSTDSAVIDDAGLAVLSLLFRNFRVILDIDRVQFTCVGLADRRGSFGYNIDLGMRRSAEVKAHIDRVFGFLPNYTGMAAYSLGELEANQRTSKASDLAMDRQVKIYSTWTSVPVKIIVKPPQAEHPKVMRVLSKHFETFTSENLTRDNSSADFKSGVKSIISIIGGDLDTFKNVWGSEDKSQQIIGNRDGSYRVNKVTIDTSFSFDTRGAALMSFYSADVKYEWGESHDYVRVEGNQTIDGKEDHTAKYVIRTEADRSDLLTPPDP